MKKKALLSVMLLVMMFTLCACGIKDVNETNYLNNRFKKYSDEYCGFVVVDTETNVMYWLSNSANNGGNLTLLVDHNGNPKIYHGGNADDCRK